MNGRDDAQVQVIEAIIVGILVFVAIAIAAVFRVPTIAGTFEQSELERLGTDVLLHLGAAVPRSGADCNEPGKCPFDSELERMVSLALRYEGATISASGERRDISPLADYFNQSLPDGARYVIHYSNGVNATRIFPLGLSAPALDVVVAHAFMTPNWTTFANQARTSALIQLDEITGFTDASTNTIHDPLNRQSEEWGRTHKSLMSNAAGTMRMPVSAVYGTYQLCTSVPTCTYFTVVPPGVYGAGSSISITDRDNSTTLVARGPLFDFLKFTDHVTSDDLLTAGERLYLDLNSNNAVNAGDLRVTDFPNCRGAGTATCVAGTYVKSLTPAEADVGTSLKGFPSSPRPAVRALLGDNDGVLDDGESIYLDVATATDTTGNRLVDANDRRLSRVATFRYGTQVAATDLDAGRALVANTPGHDFSAQTLYFGDADLDGVLDPEEPLYLDLVGNGQTPGVESLDLRLSPRGIVNQRYVYDVQAVIWFGI